MALRPIHIFLAAALAALPASAMAQSPQQRTTDEAVNRNVGQALDRARQNADRQRPPSVATPSMDQQGAPRPLSSHYENRGQMRNAPNPSRGKPSR